MGPHLLLLALDQDGAARLAAGTPDLHCSLRRLPRVDFVDLPTNAPVKRGINHHEPGLAPHSPKSLS